jgi:serine/threonine protein kinase
MTQWKIGDKIKLVDSNHPYAEIVKFLGEGGQGAVYEVKVGEKTYALKWYHSGKLKNKNAFRENIRDNIEDIRRSMASCPKFLWPKYLTEEKNNSFGYVMDLRPKEYTDFPTILNAKANFKFTDTMILAALNLVNAFRELHRRGLSYQDLNDGNFFININTGDVLICDNDNVTPDGKKNVGGVGGKPGYMAPEIVRGDAHPSERTDSHSLAVVLFKLFCRNDPLQGKEFDRLPCITEERELELYGIKPIFIYDPEDASNRPVSGVHINVIKLWPYFPTFFQKAFIDSFAIGMKYPQKRLIEDEWQRKLIQLRDQWIITCPSCGKGIFMSEQIIGKQIICGKCNSIFSYPKTLAIKNDVRGLVVPLFLGKKLYACHTKYRSDDYSTVTAEIVTNKNNPSLWGIKNLTDGTWRMKMPDGVEKDVVPHGAIPIGVGISIEFNGTSGLIG